ncbi:carbohydrate kinase family protein [Paenarthrobacter sp. DKR-5]|uniref:carbohydrate kinase family protein n=1 Tax=Paenarthrobacter sp. DKR-5 TaxID=2835535 RepID=UPI001BDBEA89|nr:PfkB family carbohydrate kinase [Paenarthrobacter sp. DKR-5]MBT1003549.1 carbohydrate kinase family protein [Paenarthrobacter sp. DKR-5]
MRQEAPAAALDALFGGVLFCDLVFAGAGVPGPGEEVYASDFALTVGGTANRCVAAARLGMRTGVVAVLGDDPLSSYVRSFLAAEPGLSLDWVETRGEAMVPVSVALASADDRSFITYEKEGTGMPDRLSSTLPKVGSCQVALSEANTPWVRDLRAAGTVIYGGVGWDSSGHWAASTLDLLDQVDVFIPNAVEAMSYTRTDSPILAAKALVQRVPLVVVTTGREGALAIDGATGEYVEVPTVPVDAVDPTGAGDVFSSAFMAASSIGWGLRTRLQFASLSASLSVRSLGGAASAPRPAELRDFLLRAKPEGDWQDILEWTGRVTEDA